MSSFAKNRSALIAVGLALAVVAVWSIAAVVGPNTAISLERAPFVAVSLPSTTLVASTSPSGSGSVAALPPLPDRGTLGGPGAGPMITTASPISPASSVAWFGGLMLAAIAGFGIWALVSRRSRKQAQLAEVTNLNQSAESERSWRKAA